MRTGMWTTLSALLVAAACGGGKIDSHEEAMEAKMDLLDEMIDILETVKDKRSAEAARPKLEALGKRMEEIDAQAAKLGPPDAESMQAAMGQMGEMMAKVMEVMSKIPQDPEIQQALGTDPLGMDR